MTTRSDREYHVRVGYHFKKMGGGRDIGMTIKAPDEETARAAAITRVIRPYPNRDLSYTIIEETT